MLNLCRPTKVDISSSSLSKVRKGDSNLLIIVTQEQQLLRWETVWTQ